MKLSKKLVFRIWALPALTALATLLIAAGSDLDQGWERVKSLPVERRAKLIEILKKFDLVYTAPQQQALKDLDRRIKELPPDQASYYFAVLRGYHNWLNQLPDMKQRDVNDRPPGERMAAVKKLIADYPPPRAKTPPFLQLADLGDHSPTELAAIFQIWQAMPKQKREQIEHIQAVPKRQDALLRWADAKNQPRELKPSDADETEWLTKLEDHIRAIRRPMLLFPDLKKTTATVGLRTEILRRMAINYHFIAHPPHAVTPQRLDDFISAFPPWLKATFDAFPPDEARRRLTVVYRLVYPHPEEMKAADRPAAPKPPPPPASGGTRGIAQPPAKPQAPQPNSPF
jgi:hypothetical protein